MGNRSEYKAILKKELFCLTKTAEKLTSPKLSKRYWFQIYLPQFQYSFRPLQNLIPPYVFYGKPGLLLKTFKAIRRQMLFVKNIIDGNNFPVVFVFYKMNIFLLPSLLNMIIKLMGYLISSNIQGHLGHFPVSTSKIFRP